MPLVLAESEVTESGISYDDRTGVSYQFPGRYRRIIQPGESFIYYKGRRKQDGGRAPQVYFGTGVIGPVEPDPDHPGRFVCKILDYRPFPSLVPFRNANLSYLESGADRRGFFQPGVRAISDDDFAQILAMAQLSERPEQAAEGAGATRPGYASPGLLRAVEDFAVRVALDEVRHRYPNAAVEQQPRNNPGFDVLVRCAESPTERLYVEVKGSTRRFPQFFMTEGEIQFSRRHAGQFRLIVIYNIQRERGTYDVLWHEGPVAIESGFRLTPVQWACEVELSKLRRP